MTMTEAPAPIAPTQPPPPPNIDSLVPPPMSRWAKFAVSIVLVSGALAVAFLSLYGFLYPQPGNNEPQWRNVFPGGYEVDGDTIAIQVRIPIDSWRDLRVTNVEFDAPGAELVRVEKFDAPFGEPRGTSSPLPATLNERYTDTAIVLWIRPLSCTDATPPWGTLTATFDFGDGAFPPISRTVTFDDKPFWTGQTVSEWIGGEPVEFEGPLALACELTR